MKLRAANQQTRRLSVCEGKERFESFAAAHRIAIRSTRRRGGALHAYSCHWCGGAHLGTPGESNRHGRVVDPRKPYAVFAKQGDSVEHYIGRSEHADGGQLKEILAMDGWTITRVVGVKRR